MYEEQKKVAMVAVIIAQEPVAADGDVAIDEKGTALIKSSEVLK